MARSVVLEEIRSLDPRRDCQRIVFLSKCHDFSFDTARALEFALFRTYCVQSISVLFDRTGEFRERPQKRYDDTEIIVNEMMEYGYDSDRGRRALLRMNHIHERFRIANSDFLYVLTTFIYEPIRWNARFGWRTMVANERLAMFHFWREVGLRMDIRDIPEEYDKLERFNVEYERDRFHFHDANRRIGELTVALFTGWYPRPLAPLVRQAIYALLDEPLLAAFGFPKGSRAMRILVPAGLRLRARLLGLMPPRRTPRLRSVSVRRPTYPDGYLLERVGPPPYDDVTAT
jgi:hypothetical protein